jgi:hypothetical protein
MHGGRNNKALPASAAGLTLLHLAGRARISTRLSKHQPLDPCINLLSSALFIKRS